jgi:hypothetical protein
MKLYASILVLLLALAGTALAGVGDLGVSDGTYYGTLKTEAGGISGSDNYPAGLSSIPSTGFQATSPSSTGQSQGQLQGASYLGMQSQVQYSGIQPQAQYPGMQSQMQYTGMQSQEVSSQGSSFQSVQPGGISLGQQSIVEAAPASTSWPRISGPYQEHFTADDLKLSTPEASSFIPDSNLNLVSTALPSGVSEVSTGGTVQGANSWYYPEQVTSRNKFYVQTTAGLSKVGSCADGGYVPMWCNVASSNNFYTYEWYPGQWTPSVRWWSWVQSGTKKVWFSGDVPGWHILCYNCQDFSNYIYIYVWPSSAKGYSSSKGAYSSGSPILSSIPQGAPTPPDLSSEDLILPDLSLVSPGGQQNQIPCGSTGPQAAYSATGSSGMAYPRSGGSPGQSNQGGQSYQHGQGAIQTVYPRCVVQRYNEYYVQTWPNRLSTVGSARCGEWLSLWSNIGSPGNYWSFEWSLCGGYPTPSFSLSEVKNFGYKKAGWYQTWFRGNKEGWHVLIYCDNDWSNYIYVYVYPVS